MFGRIAPRYDLLNHLLSFNIDRHWRNRTVNRVEEVLRRPGARVLDLCCGTGDLMLALASRRGGEVMGSDFCHPMLVEANRKTKARRLTARLFEADGLTLPVRDQSLDLVTIAFGFRNFVNYRRGLEEMFRVLRKDGMLAILEFSKPPNPLLAAGYKFYSKTILPTLGGLISGSSDAYTYLPESVRKFPEAAELAEQMRVIGFSKVSFEHLTGGIVALHLATK
jgi:demethylmenaquinone methyltransferase/2-methoxy-6-polyprenyl-1,4-benzoquinol methylase